MLQEFEERLVAILHDSERKHVIIRMASRIWNVAIEDSQFNATHFNQFVNSLELYFLDYVLVSVSPCMELQIIVFDMEDAEKVYGWY